MNNFQKDVIRRRKVFYDIYNKNKKDKSVTPNGSKHTNNKNRI